MVCSLFFLVWFALSPKIVELDLKKRKKKIFTNTHTPPMKTPHFSPQNLFVASWFFCFLLPKIKFVTDKMKLKQTKTEKNSFKLKMIFVCARCHCWMSTALEFVCFSSKNVCNENMPRVRANSEPIPRAPFNATIKFTKHTINVWAGARARCTLSCIRTTFRQRQRKSTQSTEWVAIDKGKQNEHIQFQPESPNNGCWSSEIAATLDSIRFGTAVAAAKALCL